MKILVKYPTRERPDLFLSTLTDYVNKAADNSKIIYLISYDEDDESMTDTYIEIALALPANIIFKKGISKNKIDACNRDINELPADSWDILLLISDDMIAKSDAWDERIRQDMQYHFEDTDGCLWYDDCDQKRVCTLTCMGKKYYDRFKYIYHKDYKSFYSDNEFTDIAMNMDKMVMINARIISHEHPAWNGEIKNDKLYTRNDQYWNEDQKTYNKRKRAKFII